MFKRIISRLRDGKHNKPDFRTLIEQAMVIPAAEHHQACLVRASRQAEGKNWDEWMYLAGLRPGDTVRFTGFSGRFIGIRKATYCSLVYERDGGIYRLPVNYLLIPTAEETATAI